LDDLETTRFDDLSNNFAPGDVGVLATAKGIDINLAYVLEPARLLSKHRACCKEQG
jgi:hypothetical protein